MSKNIVIFTECYPYEAVTEEVFVEPDIDALSRQFDKVIIVPRVAMGKLKQLSRWSNVVVDTTLARSFLQQSRLAKFGLLLHPFVLRYLGRNISEAKSISDFYQGCSFNLNMVTLSLLIKRLLKKHGLTSDNTVLYTFWFLYEAAALSFMSKDGAWTIVSRAHGHDVYENNRWGVFISTSMREKVLGKIKAVYPVSQAAREHMCERHPEFAGKIQVRRLGSRRLYDAKPHDAVSPAVQFVVLSVARVVPIKRVLLNLQVMQELARTNPERRFKWIHIGSGQDFAELKATVDASRYDNLQVELRGARSNHEVQVVYRDERVDLFFLLSTDEGLPISICEAMSYGVPVVVTDVGGNKEIVNENNGLVVNVDESAEMIARKITGLIDNPARLGDMSSQALRTWEDGFNENKLREAFARDLNAMINS